MDEVLMENARLQKKVEDLQNQLQFLHSFLERAKTAEERCFQIIADSAPVLLWLADTSKNCIFFNKQWLEFTGRTMEQEFGNGWADGVHADDFNRCLQIYTTAFDARKSFRMEYRLMRRDGVYRTVLDTGSPWFGVTGGFAGYVGSCIDITEIRDARDRMSNISRQQFALVKLGNTVLKDLGSSLGIGPGPATTAAHGELSEPEEMLQGNLEGDSVPSKLHQCPPALSLMSHTAEITATALNANCCSILKLSDLPGSGQLQFVVGYGWPDAETRILHQITFQDSQTSNFQLQQPTLDTEMFGDLDSDMKGDCPSSPDLLDKCGVGPQFEGLGCASSLSVPIQGLVGTYGMLCVHSKTSHRFTFDDSNMLHCFANILGSAIVLQQAYQSLHESEVLTRSIINSVASGIITVAEGGLIEGINPAAVEMFGYGPQEACCFHIWDMVPAFKPSPSTSFADLMHKFLNINTEVLGIKKNSSTSFPMELAVSEFMVQDTRLFTLIMKDLAKQKQLEATQLLVKQVMTASSEKSMFLSRMSHELRTPLNCIINMAELLLDSGEINGEQYDIIQAIQHAGNNLRTLIDDVLDLSKIEAGKMELNPQPLELRQCIENCLEMVALAAQKKGIELTLFMDESVPKIIVVDGPKLRQVFINILGNAIKFTNQGDVSITVKCQEQPTPDECVLHFCFEDSGIGIPADKIDALFKDFSQVHHSSTSDRGSSGLGLAISKRIIGLLEGRIWVESVFGTGSAFHFFIKVGVPTVASRVSQHPLHDFIFASPSKFRVLIIESNRRFRQMLLQLCWISCLQATGLPSVQDALVHLGASSSKDMHYQIGMIPYQTPIELAKSLHQLARFPLILTTPLSLYRVHDTPLGSLCAASLPKPIKLVAMQDAFYRVLAGVHPSIKKSADSNFDHKLASVLPLSILVAEDNPTNQKVAEMLFRRLGYTVDWAYNGIEVLEAMERKKYDIIFMDVEMPDMDGLECARIICSKHPADERPAIVAQTAHAMQEDLRKCLDAGMVDFLSKPLKVDMIVKVLKRLKYSHAPPPLL